MYFKKALILLLSVSLFVFSFAACGSNSNSNSAANSADTGNTNSSTEAEVKETVTETPVTVTVAGDIDNKAVVEEAFSKINEEFQKQNPNIKLQYDYSMNQTTLQVALKSNDLPDSFWCQGSKTPVLKEMVKNGFVTPVDDYVDKSLFTQEQLDYGIVDGKLYCSPPAFIDTIVVYYNKDIFSQNGLKAPETWDEFINIVETLKSKNIQPLALSGSDEWGRVWPVWLLGPLHASDALKACLNGQGTMMDEDIVSVLNYYREWIEKGYFGKDIMSDPLLAFTNGKAAMVINGSWANSTFEASGVNVGRFFIPDETGKKIAFSNFSNFDTYVISSNSKNKEAAGKYIDFLSSVWSKQVFEDHLKLPSTMKGVNITDESTKEMSSFDAIGLDLYSTLTALTAGDLQPCEVLLKQVLPDLMTQQITAEKAAELLHNSCTYPGSGN